MAKYKMTPAHKKKISMAQKRRWDKLQEEYDLSVIELQQMGITNIPTFREFQRMETPAPPKQPYRMTEAHKQKLRKAAIKGGYAASLKTHQFKKIHKTKKQQEEAKQAKRVRAQRRNYKRNQDLKFARLALVGGHGMALQRKIGQKLGGINPKNKTELLRVVYFLREIGFLEEEPNTVSLETREKMRQSALRRHERERIEKEQREDFEVLRIQGLH